MIWETSGPDLFRVVVIVTFFQTTNVPPLFLPFLPKAQESDALG